MQRSDLETLRRAIAATPRNERGYRRFSGDLKQRLARYAIAEQRRGHSLLRTAQSLDVGDALLCRWVRESRNSQRGGVMLPVEVEGQAADDTLCLQGPGGVRIDGLSVETAAALLRALA